MNKFVIIDGNAIVHRAYHAVPPMTTKEGLLVNAAYGFTSMLFKVINDLKPAYLAVTFDMAGGSKARLEKFADYKGTRVKADQALYDQIPLTHTVVSALGIPVFEKSGYEADDVIGTLVKNVTRQCHPEQSEGSLSQTPVETFIVTGDMDALQLVDEHVKVYTLRKGINDIVIYDIAAVSARFGFGPEMMVDYKAIRGDTSDNIPGVPGIGEKGATELIQNVGGIEEIYKKIDSLKALGIKDGVIKKLVAGQDSARMSRELATIDCAVPDLDFALEKCRLPDFDREKILPIFQKLEFISLLKRLPGAAIGNEEKNQTKKSVKLEKEIKVVEIKDDQTLTTAISAVMASRSVAARVFVGGTDFFAGSLDGILLLVGNSGYYGAGKWCQKLLPIFTDEKNTVVGHDLKPAIKALLYHAKVCVSARLFDTMIASYLLNPGTRSHDIASIVLKTLGKELPVGVGQESLFGIDYRAAAQELYMVSRAAEILKKDLEKTNDAGLLEKIEMPLEIVLGQMELNGVAVDKAKLQELSERVATEIATVTKTIHTLAGFEFNISSPMQLREALFEKMDIPVEGIKKGKTGLSTSADELEKLRGAHPIIEEIMRYREITKLQNTYIDVLPTLISKTTGRIHTTFNQAVAATGRLSSTDPNLQNIPIRTDLGREIRDAFISEKGYTLISADYSQIELRIAASLAEDKQMIAIFERDEDIHTATAAAIHGIPLEKVTKEIRRTAKEVNFGVLYGMGVHGLSWRAGISYAEAKDFIDKYFAQFSGVKKYMEATLAFTKKEGYCETLFGRRRYLPDLNSTNFQAKSAAERMAINHPVQGTAADLMKIAMIKVHEELSKKYSLEDVKITLQVHDELVLEVKNKLTAEVSAVVKDLMEGVVKLRVPVKVEVGAGTRWGEIK